jgi:N12 class adenine-specific DNA methylase/predicted RNA methylase
MYENDSTENPSLLKTISFEQHAPNDDKPNTYVSKMREMYPMYKDVDDTTLALAFKSKHYSSLSDDEFLQKIDLNQKPLVINTQPFTSASDDNTATQPSISMGINQSNTTPSLPQQPKEEKPFVVNTASLTSASDDNTATRPSIFTGVDENNKATYLTPQAQDEKTQQDNKAILFGNGQDFTSKEWNFNDEVTQPFLKATKEVAHNSIMAEAVTILGDDVNDPEKLKQFLAFKDDLDKYNPMHHLEKGIANMDVKENTSKHTVDSFLEAYKKEGVLSTNTWMEFFKAVPSVTAGSIPNTAQMLVNFPKATEAYAYQLAKDSLEADGIQTEPTRTDMAKSAPVALLINSLDKFGFSKASEPLKKEFAEMIVKNPAKKFSDIVKSFTQTTVHGIKYELPTEVAQEIAEVVYVKDKDVTGEDILKSSIGALMGTMGMTAGISGVKEVVRASKPTSKESVIADALNDIVDGASFNQDAIEQNVRASLSPQYAQYRMVSPETQKNLNTVSEGYKALEEELFGQTEQLKPQGEDTFTGENESATSIVKQAPVQSDTVPVQSVAIQEDTTKDNTSPAQNSVSSNDVTTSDESTTKLNDLKSVLIAFPDAPVTMNGDIALSIFSSDEQEMLRKHDLIETSKDADGKEYEGVNPNILWELRKEYQDKNNQIKKSTIDDKIEGAKKRRLIYLSWLREEEDLGDLASAEKLNSLGSKVAEMDTILTELEKEKANGKSSVDTHQTSATANEETQAITSVDDMATLSTKTDTHAQESVTTSDEGQTKSPMVQTFEKEIMHMEELIKAWSEKGIPDNELSNSVKADLQYLKESGIVQELEANHEVMFKESGQKRAKRGILFNLPFGFKGVIISDAKGVGGKIFEYSTASYAGAFTSLSTLPKTLLNAHKKFISIGEETLKNNLATMNLVNPSIIEAEIKKDGTENFDTEVSIILKDGTFKTIKGERYTSKDGLEIVLHKNEQGKWVATEVTTGMGLPTANKDGDTSRTRVKEGVEERIKNLGIEKVKKSIADVLKDRRINQAKKELSQSFNSMSQDEKRALLDLTQLMDDPKNEIIQSAKWNTLDPLQQRVMVDAYLQQKEKTEALKGGIIEHYKKDTSTNTQALPSEQGREDSGTTTQEGSSQSVQPNQVKENSDANAQSNTDSTRDTELSVHGSHTDGREPSSGISENGQRAEGGTVSETNSPSDDRGATNPTPARNEFEGSTGDSGTSLHSGNVNETPFVQNVDDVIASGDVSRYHANIDAIKLLQQNKAFYTAEEKETLSRYTGWGGLQKAFRDGAGMYHAGWEKRAIDLQYLLGFEEYAQAQKSILDAYYTPLPLVKAMWDIAQVLGFKGGLVLEPSMGTGRFIGMTPADVRGKTAFNGVEIDTTTYKIATALYGNLNGRNMGFETTNHKGNHDLVIGNPPYGSFKLYDKNNKAYNTLTAHNYFVVKSLDALKEGGVLNFVISTSFLDNLDAKTIELINQKAKMIGAIRLSSDAFSDAGTSVSTDIVLFQKLRAGESGNSEVWSNKGDINGVKINQYFVDNPSMLLGTWEKGFRGAGTLKASGNLYLDLSKAISLLPRNVMSEPTGSVASTKTSQADSTVAPSVMYVKDGSVYVNIKEGEGVSAKALKATKEKAELYINVRDALLTLIDMQLDERMSDVDVEAQRSKVNHAYDTFVKRFGAFNQTANRSFIVNDKNGYLISTLEERYQPEIKEGNKKGLAPQAESYTKADILSKRTASPIKEISTDSSIEALTFCLNQKGGVDFDYMQRITGKDKEMLLKELHGHIFFDANEGYVTREVFLSGDVKTKYANATDEYTKNELLKVIPADVSAKDITPEFGQKWMGVKVVETFLEEKLGYRSLSISQSNVTSKWYVEGYVRSFPFSADRVKDNTIVESALNNKQIKIYNTDKYGKRTLNVEKTDLANAKVEELKEAFAEWVFSERNRRDELVARYNEINNRFAPLQASDKIKEYTIPNIKFFVPREHQTRAVYKAVFGNTPLLLNHAVGSGKTLTSQMIAMELRRLGKAQKPLITTLKSVVPQYASEFKEAYPSAKILVPTEADFTPDNRQRLLSAIATGDYDAIIVSHEQLQKIENPLELQKKIIEEELQALETALQEAKKNKDSDRSRRDIENAKEKLQNKYKKLSDQDKDSVLSFEKLGIDALIVDESHKFKKLAYSSTLGQIKGMPSTTGSNMAFDLHVKARHVLENNNNRNVVFMTGTPITNTIPELFLIQKFLQAPTLKAQGVDNFDSWAKNYVEQTTEVEITSTGGFKEVTRIKNFKNLPTLIQATSQIIDTVTNEDIKKSDTNFKLPPLKDGKPTLVFIEPSEEQLAYNQELIERVMNLKKDSPDNHLVIFKDAGKMSIDMRLISDKYSDAQNSKVNAVVERALAKYKEFDSVKGTQLIFSDTGVPKGGGKAKAKLESLIELADKGDESASKELEGYSDAEIEDILNGGQFSIYEDIKKKLVMAGVPDSEVVFIHDYDTKEKKQQLGRDVNAGKIRFVIGSTQKLGTGINVQQRITAVHHIDIPYTPAELEQRNGRIIRQGNKLLVELDNFQVEILYYATKRTLDGMKWQILENKSKFIKQFFDGVSNDDIEIEEMSNSELAEVMKAEASGNPLLLEKIKNEKLLKKLRSLKRSYELSRMETDDKLLELSGFLASVDSDIEALQNDIAQINSNPVTINGVALEKAKEIGDTLIEAIHEYKTSKSTAFKTVGNVGDVEIAISYDYARDKAKIALNGESEQHIEYDFTKPSGSGLGVIFSNRLKSYETKKSVLEKEKPQALQDVQRLNESKDVPFQKIDELKEAEEAQLRIVREIAEKAKEKPAQKESTSEDGDNSYMYTPQSSSYASDFKGTNYTDTNLKGDGAVSFLMDKQEGYIEGAFNHTLVGDIDLIWGDSKAGLKHILEERTKQWGEEKAKRFIAHLTDIFENGIVVVNEAHPTRIELVNPKSTAVVELTFSGEHKSWLMSAYKDSSNKSTMRDIDSLMVYAENVNKDKAIVTIAKNGTVSLSSISLNDIITNMKAHSQIIANKETTQSEADNSFARANGYDNPAVNYVPTYTVAGMPVRPTNSVITIGTKEIKLPSLEKPINADSIRVYLSDIIGNRLYEGRIKNKSALGVYARKDSSIRVKNYSDVEVMAHEMAHYLDFFYKNTTKSAQGSFFRAEILKNKEEIKALSYTTKPNAIIKEGFAEFVRLWLTNYNILTALAPNMVKDFEARLAKDKTLEAKMYQLQEGMHSYFYQGEHAQLRSKRGGELNSTAKAIQRSQQEIGRDIRQKAIDKIHIIKRIEAEIKGDVDNDAMNSAYKTLQMVNGHSSIMYGAMNIGVPTIVNGDITYSGKSLNAIFEPATKVSEERVKLLEDYLVAKRASELMGQGRENLITEKEIEAGLELENIYPEFETIFNEYQAFNDKMLDFYVEMKLITDEQRDSFKEFNKNYVPFHRITESVQYGKVPPSTIGQRLTGGTHSLDNIMDNIINGIESNIKEALIARGKSLFYDMLEKSGEGGAWAIRVGTDSKKVQADIKEQAKHIATIMASLGLTISKDGMIISGNINSSQIIDIDEIQDNLLLNPQTLEFWTHGHKPTSNGGYIDTAIIDGKRVYFETFDKGLVDAMTSFSSEHYGVFMQALMTAKNIMTWNITNNPLFYLTNFARDTISASVLSKNNFIPIVSSIAGMYHFITKSKVYKEFMASGAGNATRQTNLGGDLQAMKMLNVNRGLDIIGKIISALEYGADVFENGTRIGDFALSQKAGKSNWQSAYEAREVSTDFAIKGSHTGFTGFMATIPFMKAGINGIDKTMKRIFSLNGEMKLSNAVKFRNQLGELQAHKIKIYIAGSLIAGATLALYMQNRDDERYKKLTRDQKLMYWNFFIGDKHIKIPRPYDIGFMFSSIPEIVADMVYTKHGEEALKDFLWGMKTMFSVGDVSGLFQPILDMAKNENWTGSPIVPSNLEKLADKADQYTESTPMIYRALGKATGLSPIKMQYFVDGYLGLTAKMIEEGMENILWNKKEWGDRPFARNPLEFITYRFQGKEQDPRTKWSEQYYELKQKADEMANSLNKKKARAYKDTGADAKEFVNSPEHQRYILIDKKLNEYDRMLTRIKTSVEATYYDKSLSAKEKEKRINDAYKMRTDFFERVVTKVKELGVE